MDLHDVSVVAALSVERFDGPHVLRRGYLPKEGEKKNSILMRINPCISSSSRLGSALGNSRHVLTLPACC